MFAGYEPDILDWSSRYECAFVFFFKQKTAYEMRISDWSSDVCPSDLRTFGEPENRRFSAASLTIRGPGTPAPVWAGLRVLGSRLSALRALIQIGRASCRERACQYA